MAKRILRVYVGVPVVRYDPQSSKLTIIADNVVIMVPLSKVFEALLEKGMVCRCERV